MPIFQLTEELVFPHPNYANSDGILAVGGDLSPQRLILAYQNGIFPWYNADDPIIWWSPEPRCVLYTNKLNISKSMRQALRKAAFQVSLDKAFEKVVSSCEKIERKGQNGTWITPEMKLAYVGLYELGFAHSVEVWNKEELVGGLYGVFIGTVFFGESMFSKESNASKYGFIKLAEALNSVGIELIDCQTTTDHLLSLGAEEIPRETFLNTLKENTEVKSTAANWNKVVQHFNS